MLQTRKLSRSARARPRAPAPLLKASWFVVTVTDRNRFDVGIESKIVLEKKSTTLYFSLALSVADANST